MKAKVLLLNENLKTQEDLSQCLVEAGFGVDLVRSWEEAFHKCQSELYNFFIPCLEKIEGHEVTKINEIRDSQEKNLVTLLVCRTYGEDSKVATLVKQTGASGFYFHPVDGKKIVNSINRIFFDETYEATAFEILMSSPNWNMAEFESLYKKSPKILGFEIPFLVSRILEGRANTALRFFENNELVFVLHFLNGNIHRLDLYENNTSRIKEILISDLKQFQVVGSEKDYDFSSLEVLDELTRDGNISSYMANTARQNYLLDQLRQYVCERQFSIEFAPFCSGQSNLLLSKEQVREWLVGIVKNDLPLDWVASQFRSLNRFTFYCVDKIYGEKYVVEEIGVSELLVNSIGKGLNILDMFTGGLFDQDSTYVDLYNLCCRGVIWFDDKKVQCSNESMYDLIHQRLQDSHRSPFKLLGLSHWHETTDVKLATRAESFLLESFRAESKMNAVINDYLNACRNFCCFVEKSVNFVELKQNIREKNRLGNLQKNKIENQTLDCLKYGELSKARALVYSSIMTTKSSNKCELLQLWLELKSLQSKKISQAFKYEAGRKLERMNFAEKFSPIYHYVQALYQEAIGKPRQSELSLKTSSALDLHFIPSAREIFLESARSKVKKGFLNLGQIARSRYFEGQQD